VIEIVPTVRDNVLAVKAVGKVTREDYSLVLIPAVEEMLKKYDKIRFIYELGRDFRGFTAGALWDDAKVGFRHLTAFEKIAVISDEEWITTAVTFFALFIPCPVKIFRTEEMSSAQLWINE
jgi:hypothetical protein